MTRTIIEGCAIATVDGDPAPAAVAASSTSLLLQLQSNK